MRTILILDDNKACSATLKMTLMGRGYRICRTMEVQYVIDHACSTEFDLLLVNHAYHKACGWDVFNHLARVVPHLPVMVYVMDHPDTSAAGWIARAVDAVSYEIQYATSRCPGIISTRANGFKRVPQVFGGCSKIKKILPRLL